jgi:hypothetical protein
MGTTAGDKTLEIDYPLAFSNHFSRTLLVQNKKFRYIHLSGAATERNQERPLWFKGYMRKIKVPFLNPTLRFSTANNAIGTS